jgi:hypothetical protein
MFSLIITIISIALVAALALASIYYGGNAFTSGSAKSAAAAVVNQAQQISAAWVMYANDNGGSDPAALGDLVTGEYLQVVPKPSKASVTDSAAVWTISGTSLNLAMGASKDSVCESIVSSIEAGATVASAQNGDRQYDCFGATDKTFVYKVR